MSRCRTDSRYVPSKVIIESQAAADILMKTIKATQVHKDAQDFCMALDTFYVESFNNVLNVFHDKRIAFSNDHYKVRTNLAILHWNENVNRDFTSVWSPLDDQLINPQMCEGKKVYKPPSSVFKDAIWSSFISTCF